MTIKHLQVRGVRNLENIDIRNCGNINIFTGANGSGKTSILESLFILSRARSFRSNKMGSVISHLAPRCIVFGELHNQSTIGIMRSRNDRQLFKINGNPVNTASQLAGLLPLQLINADSFSLLEGGPSIRRQFLDWGVFHVEPDFFFYWRRIQKAIKHRNSLLRRGRIAKDEVAAWDSELLLCSEAVDRMRSEYIQKLHPHFLYILNTLTSLDRPELRYRRGWDENLSLEKVLIRDWGRDVQQCVTHSGAHRADIEIRIGGKAAGEVLSRGQEKLLACALRLAQGVLLHELKGKTCIYLLDDLPAELDMYHRKILCSQLSKMRSQVFLTATDTESLQGCWPSGSNTRWFHVEHGQIYENHELQSL